MLNSIRMKKRIMEEKNHGSQGKSIKPGEVMKREYC
jgi:hypothetical protein